MFHNGVQFFCNRNKNVWSRGGDCTALCYTRFTLFILFNLFASQIQKNVWGRGGERRRRLRNFQTFSWASPSVQRRLWPPNNQAWPLQLNLNCISQVWKCFMILGFLVLDSWSGFGLTDSLRLSISDTNNHDACFNNSFGPSKYALYWGHYYGPGNTNPKHRNNCQCCPGHYLIVNHYSSMSWFNLNCCLCSHCSQCLLVSTSVY